MRGKTALIVCPRKVAQLRRGRGEKAGFMHFPALIAGLGAGLFPPWQRFAAMPGTGPDARAKELSKFAAGLLQ